ncbi:MAG: AbrB/MazE/SpoVT family DNA-binding domain-containing protein [Saprospiraceae bacterium]|uniref:AbrB/MazE/SpoVT family DNA-binding domain-containing protein n=1 Tax=Candidatus Opimibacter skivensis TaxID=2982028 RepID=A0A9D7STI5_9BACT|nr:AbrB/MazE/SpoVT family DNA-binding domain-containing protein [Candidatus Opimibacter skivensis]
MKIAIIKIGNSKGIRLSKMLLAKYQIEDEVELIMEEAAILIKPIAKPRQDWDKAFAKMRKSADDNLLIESVLSPDDWE